MRGTHHHDAFIGRTDGCRVGGREHGDQKDKRQGDVCVGGEWGLHVRVVVRALRLGVFRRCESTDTACGTGRVG